MWRCLDEGITTLEGGKCADGSLEVGMTLSGGMNESPWKANRSFDGGGLGIISIQDCSEVDFPYDAPESQSSGHSVRLAANTCPNNEL